MRKGRALTIKIEPRDVQRADDGGRVEYPPSAAFDEALKLIAPLVEQGGTGGRHELHVDPSRGRSGDPTYTDWIVNWTIRDTPTKR